MSNGPEVRIALPPVQYDVRDAPGPDGKQQVMLIFQTIYGITQIPFDPNNAIDFANKVRRVAKASAAGLTIVGDVGGGSDEDE